MGCGGNCACEKNESTGGAPTQEQSPEMKEECCKVTGEECKCEKEGENKDEHKHEGCAC